MTDTLDLPTINADALSPTPATKPAAAAVAVVTDTNLDLTTLDLEAVALARFNDARAAVAKATETLTGVVHDLSTPSKLADAKSLRNRLIKKPLAEAREVSAALKSKLTTVSRAVGVELVAIEADFEKASALITPQIEARDAEIAAEEKRKADEAAAKAAEAAKREEWLQGELAKIISMGAACKDLPATRVAAGIEYVEGLAFGDEWGDAAPRAAQAQAQTVALMRTLLAEKLAAEQAAAAAEALRVENERKAAELAERERRMHDIQRINAYVPEAQAAIVGKNGAEACAILNGAIDLIAPMDTTAEGPNQLGDFAPMAEMAKGMVLHQLRQMLAEATARGERETQERVALEAEAAARAKAEADEQAAQEAAALAAAQAAAAALVEDVAAGTAIATMEPAELDAWATEHPPRDWPDLQSAELAVMPDEHSRMLSPAEVDALMGSFTDDALNEPAGQTDADVAEFHAQAAADVEAVGRDFLLTSAGFDPVIGGGDSLQEAIGQVHYTVRAHSPSYNGIATRTIDVVSEESAGPTVALLAHIATAREGRFPSHPKPSQEWWTELFRLAGEVQA